MRHASEHNINLSAKHGYVLTARGLQTPYVQPLLGHAGLLMEDQELRFDQDNLTAHLNKVS